MKVRFNHPKVVGRELEHITEAIESAHIAGGGSFSRRCGDWLRGRLDVPAALVTHSCTAALEMAALLCDLEPGDEVIMPSFTFTSTANAVALRGACPVFVDVRADTLNLDENLIEAAVTPRTRAMFVVHYAGVGCAMDRIMQIAEKHRLVVVEDAAQALLANYRGRPLGSIGHMSAFSFHQTKNIISGEGGALVLNDPRFLGRAEVIRENGTNRSSFFRGEVSKYTWMDVGSTYFPSDMIAAFLLAQLEQADRVTAERRRIWERYNASFAELEAAGVLRRPVVPKDCEGNGHLFYLLLPDRTRRDALIAALRSIGIEAPFHYVPLHTAPAGKRFGRVHGKLWVTEDIADRLVRLPVWYGIGEAQSFVIDAVHDFFKR